MSKSVPAQDGGSGMRKCFDCDGELPPKAAFCPHCGRQISKGNRAGAAKKRHKQERSQEGVAAYNVFRASLKEKARKRNLAAVLVLIAGIVIGVVAGDHSDVSVFSFFLAGGAFPFLWVNPGRWMTKREYYALPGSTQDGKHQCIFCGNKGIYQQGQYASNNKYAYCSKCNASLFAS